MASCHTQVHFAVESTDLILRTIQERGADFAKVVTMTFNPADLLAMWNYVSRVRSKARIPYNIMNTGEYAILGRLVSTSLGSSWIYCRTSRRHGYLGQPSISVTRALLKGLGRKFD
jgi:3-dehydroquinate dehydratase